MRALSPARHFRSTAASTCTDGNRRMKPTPQGPRLADRDARRTLKIFLGASTGVGKAPESRHPKRSEEHTSELQSLMRISYAVFCLKKKKNYYVIYIYLS